MSPAAMARALETLGTALVEMRQAPDPRVDLEVAFVRLCRPVADRSLDALADRVETLERHMAGGATPAVLAAPPAGAETVAEPPAPSPPAPGDRDETPMAGAPPAKPPPVPSPAEAEPTTAVAPPDTGPAAAARLCEPSPRSAATAPYPRQRQPSQFPQARRRCRRPPAQCRHPRSMIRSHYRTRRPPSGTRYPRLRPLRLPSRPRADLMRSTWRRSCPCRRPRWSNSQACIWVSAATMSCRLQPKCLDRPAGSGRVTNSSNSGRSF